MSPYSFPLNGRICLENLLNLFSVSTVLEGYLCVGDIQEISQNVYSV